LTHIRSMTVRKFAVAFFFALLVTSMIAPASEGSSETYDKYEWGANLTVVDKTAFPDFYGAKLESGESALIIYGVESTSRVTLKVAGKKILDPIALKTIFEGKVVSLTNFWVPLIKPAYQDFEGFVGNFSEKWRNAPEVTFIEQKNGSDYRTLIISGSWSQSEDWQASFCWFDEEKEEPYTPAHLASMTIKKGGTGSGILADRTFWRDLVRFELDWASAEQTSPYAFLSAGLFLAFGIFIGAISIGVIFFGATVIAKGIMKESQKILDDFKEFESSYAGDLAELLQKEDRSSDDAMRENDEDT
jgi:hypothetical protein